MNDEEIRKAACEAWDAAGVGMWGIERATAQAIAVFRAGMAAERARCIAVAHGEACESRYGDPRISYLLAYNDGIYAVVERLKAGAPAPSTPGQASS